MEARAEGSRSLSRLLASLSLIAGLVGGAFIGTGSLLAIVLAVGALSEGRRALGYRPYFAWTALVLSVAAATLMAWFLYWNLWDDYHHPGGGGPIPQPDGDLWTLFAISSGVGFIGLLVLVAAYRRARHRRAN